MAVCVSAFHKCLARSFPATKVVWLHFQRQSPIGALSSHQLINRRTFSNSSALLASGRRYTEQHEWVEVQDGVGTVGVTDYAQGALGDVVFAQLPDPGAELKQMDECGALESVKAASELYSPVSGTVTEKNQEVEETPGLINQSAYDKGWLFKIKLSQPSEVDALLDEAGYEKHLKSTEK